MTEVPVPPASRISIHVLRVEDDKRHTFRCRWRPDFNPRPPCGGRRFLLPACQALADFNPRPPCGGRPTTPCSGSWTHDFNPRPPCGGRREKAAADSLQELFQSTSSVWRTTAKTEKNLYLHSYNTAICIDLQSHQSVHAHVCTNNPKQSPKKPVRSIRVCSDCSMFARPLSPDGALRKSERHPAGRRGERRRVPLCSGNGCPTGKSAGCPLPGRSVWSARP